MAEQTYNPFESRDISPAHNDEWEAKRRLGRAINRLSETLMTSVPPVEEMHRMAERLEQVADTFGGYPRLYGRMEFLEDGNHGGFGELSHELNPLAGLSNPLAPPINVWFKDGEAFGEVTMGWQYEGPPDHVHGGYVAAVFDQFLGATQALAKQPGMTRTLEVTYHRPTPVNTLLNLQGRVVLQEGRKTRIVGEMYAGDQLTADCEGLFIRPRQGLIRGPLGED